MSGSPASRALSKRLGDLGTGVRSGRRPSAQTGSLTAPALPGRSERARDRIAGAPSSSRAGVFWAPVRTVVSERCANLKGFLVNVEGAPRRYHGRPLGAFGLVPFGEANVK